MYFHQVMAQEDSCDFVEAVVKVVNDHVDNSHWKLVPIKSVPEDTNILPSVWSMRRNINLITNEITKYKARLNVHGGKQTFGENYFDTYAPIFTWSAIRLPNNLRHRSKLAAPPGGLHRVIRSSPYQV